MKIDIVAEARDELDALPAAERIAMDRAIEKLALFGDQLRFPHSSQVRGTPFRELRPRAGRSPWRAFYLRAGDRLIVAAVGPEAQHDARGFRRAVEAAMSRVASLDTSG